MKKKNFFSLVILACVSLVLLTSCTKTTARKSVVEDKTINYIELVDKNGEYTFASSNNVIDYKENLSFNSNDFTLKIYYANGSTEEIQSGFTFTLYKIDNTEETVTGNLLPGSYKISIVYNNSVQEVLFSISPITLNKDEMTVSLENSYTFIPNESIEPDIDVTFNNKALIKDTDYEIVYGSNASIGKNQGLVIINGKGIYSGSVQYNFEITKRNMGVINLEAEVNYTYDGKDPRITIEKDFSDVEGVSSVEYQYFNEAGGRVFDVSESGTYQVKVKVNPQYGYNSINTKTFTLKVNPFDISIYTLEDLNLTNFTVPYEYNSFTSDDIDAMVRPLIPYDLDCMIGFSHGDNIDNREPSTDTVHGAFYIRGLGNYTGEIIVSYKILPIDINDVIVEVSSDTYTGDEITLDLYYQFEYTRYQLEVGRDYTIEYSNNTEPGTASYTIVGLKRFSGTKEGTFKINKIVINPFDYYDFIDFSTKVYTYTGENQEVSDMLQRTNATTLDLDSIFSYEYSYLDLNKNPIAFNEAGYYNLVVTFKIKDAHYTFPNVGMTTDVNECAMSKQGLEMREASLFIDFVGPTSYIYTGEVIEPGKEVFNLTTSAKALVYGEDYEIKYLDEAVNANTGYRIQFILRNNNYLTFDTSYNRVSSPIYEFSITPKELKESDLTIAWPTVYKEVCVDSYSLGNNGLVKLGNKEIDSSFTTSFILMPEIEGLYHEAIILTLRDTNYKIVNDYNRLSKYVGPVSEHPELEYVNYELVNNWFDTFTVDGVSLTLTELESFRRSSKINYNSNIIINLKDGYTVSYKTHTNNQDIERNFSEKAQTLNIRAGIDKNYADEDYLPSDVDQLEIRIYDSSDNSRHCTFYLNIIKIELTSPLDKAYDGQAYIPEYNVYIPNTQSKVLVFHLVDGVYQDYNQDIINVGRYRLDIRVYAGNPETSQLLEVRQYIIDIL